MAPEWASMDAPFPEDPCQAKAKCFKMTRAALCSLWLGAYCKDMDRQQSLFLLRCLEDNLPLPIPEDSSLPSKISESLNPSFRDELFSFLITGKISRVWILQMREVFRNDAFTSTKDELDRIVESGS